MASPGGPSALIAAFTFGIVVNGASAALFLNVKGHGSTIFRDGLRLALTAFLLSAALWAQVGFVATTIDVTSASACSITSIVTALFDQLARFSIEQFMLWGMKTKNNSGAGQLVLQGILAVRFIAGGVFVGFVRRQEQGVCAPISSLLPVSVAVIALDAIIIVTLVARAFSVGVVEDAKSGVARSKAVVWILVGFAIWSGTSVTLLLGMPTMDLTLRTALPATGLSLLIIIVTGSIDSFSSVPRQRQSRPPESPRRDLDTRDISTPVSGAQGYPPLRYEDLKREEVNMSEAYSRPREAPTAPAGPVGMPQGGAVVIGRHGVPVQGALFPPPRPANGPAPLPRQAVAPQQGKKNVFETKGGPAAAVAVGGKLAISNPILQSDSEMNPLNKIPTMDLATAAQQDKERREMWTRMQRESTLIASRPAPRPPTSDGDDRVAPATALSPMPVGMAKTTSAQLSPGGEELRRRSPRQSPDPQEAEAANSPKSARSARAASPLRQDVSESRAPSPPPAPKSASAKSTAFPPPRQKQPPFPMKRTKSEAPPRVIGAPTGAERANMAPTADQFQAPLHAPIRPSRQRDETSESAPAPPPKTPLQRRPTIGLPGNPRARAMTTTAPVAPGAETSNQQTIMFINDITYDDPSTVQKIIDGANTGKLLDRETHELEFGLRSSKSVVHRPRPIPRKSDKDRAIFPVQSPPSLRRSKSSGSIASRKSILQAYPGSPTQLPPLPPPPKSAGGFSFSRPHPNDTKSMTFDEKMNIFYPSGVAGSRRSSVPEMPAIPAIPPSNFFDMSEAGTQIRDEAGSRDTRTTKSSFKTESVLDVEDLARTPGQQQTARDSPRSGGRGEIDSIWIAGIERDERWTQRPSMRDVGKRASSPILPPARESLWAESTNMDAKTPTDVGTTAWGSVHSPVAPVNIQRMAEPPRSTYIRPRQISGAPPVPAVPAGLSTSPMSKEDDGESIHIGLDTMGLDTSIDSSTDASIADSPQTPVGADEDFVLSNNVFPIWHKRVGDDLLTFSERKEKMRSRMPPPTPLLLRTAREDGPARPRLDGQPGDAPAGASRQSREGDGPLATHEARHAEGRPRFALDNPQLTEHRLAAGFHS
ncbi:hypothetical protein MAPG_05408 [Magnaporthiopsis poae ATCC 64411]|uniref:Uncharacterized protein n=1 Tax=Magnaporthiopsis poae (strain ATCC 64411 / 73-15) TaxID=644358 RepID=A0A0C4DZB3_MAGP6|nr:hypothetical protein MAPG_05408 [Magnaporthiopsis poae ATCC 64411]